MTSTFVAIGFWIASGLTAYTKNADIRRIVSTPSDHHAALLAIEHLPE